MTGSGGNERYVCNLSPELLKRAVEELNEPENNEDRLKAIDQLRDSYDEAKNGPLARKDDAFILRFLRAKKFDQAKALKVLVNWHKVQVEYEQIFSRMKSPALFQPLVESQCLYILPGDAKDGACAMHYRPGLLKTVDIWDLMAYSVYSLEKCLEIEKYQITGIRSIEDMENFSFTSMFREISPTALAKMNAIWLDSMPMRFRGSHLLNEGKFYDIMMKVFKPFLKQKILDRIHLHGKDYKSLQEFFTEENLPSTLGGSGPSTEECMKLWTDKVSADWPQDTAL